MSISILFKPSAASFTLLMVEIINFSGMQVERRVIKFLPLAVTLNIILLKKLDTQEHFIGFYW